MGETAKQLSLQCCNYLKAIYWNSNFQTLRDHYGRSMRHYRNSSNEGLIWNSARENGVWTFHGTDNVGRQMTDFCSIMLPPLVQRESICSCSCSSGCHSSKTTGKSRDQCITVLYLCIFAVSEEISYSHPSVFCIYKRKSNSKGTGYLQRFFSYGQLTQHQLLLWRGG